MTVKDELKPTIADRAHTVVSAVASMVPGGSEIFNAVFTKPIEKRRDKIIVDLSHMLETLKEKGVSIEELQNNDRFVSAVLYVSSIAMRNHSDEKRRALLNAITNIAINPSIDETKERMFLNYIDELTDWHLKILWYFENPRQRFEEKGVTVTGGIVSSVHVFFYQYYDKTDISEELLKIICSELDAKGLTQVSSSLHGNMSEDGALTDRVTPFGREFIKFITTNV